MAQSPKNQVVLTLDEAQQILALLRHVQMNLSALSPYVRSDKKGELSLLSIAFAGELMNGVNLVEQSIWERGIVTEGTDEDFEPPELN